MRKINADLSFWLLLLVGAVFLLKGLDHTLFWQDEGHNAVLAKRILEFGYPRVWDGRNLLTGMDGLDFNDHYALTWDGWLPYYLAASFFALFGVSTWSGRLPFVVCALGSLPLFYYLVLRIVQRRSTAFWSTFFLMSSIMFLLHSRQCRYYALLPLGVLIALWGVVSFPSWKGIALTTLGLVVLYHSNLVSFITFYVSLLSLPAVFECSRQKVRSFLLSSCFTFLLTIPMFLYSQMWMKAGTRSPQKWNQLVGTMLGDIVILNKFYIPLIFLVIGYYLYKNDRGTEEPRFFKMGLIFIAVPSILIAFVLGPTVRYLYHIFPIAAFLAAMILMKIYQKRRYIGVLFFLLFLSSHFFDYLPFKAVFALSNLARRMVSPPVAAALRYVHNEYTTVDDEESSSQIVGHYRRLHIPTFWERFWKGEYRSYWNEIAQPFPDNIPIIIHFLKEHRLPNEGVYLNVGQVPLMFYDPEIKIVDTMTRAPTQDDGVQSIDSSQWDWEAITWFIPRPFQQTRGPYFSEHDFISLVEAKGWKVIAHSLPVSPYYWDGNWPEHFRLYRSLHGEFPLPPDDSLVIYQVKRS